MIFYSNVNASPGRATRRLSSSRGSRGLANHTLQRPSPSAAGGAPHMRLRFQCSPYHTNSTLRPFIAQLERAARFKADDTPEQRLEKLEAILDLDASRVQTVAPLFAALLSIPFGDRYQPLALSPTQQRRQTLAALLDQFEVQRPPATDPTLVRGCALGGCHVP